MNRIMLTVPCTGNRVFREKAVLKQAYFLTRLCKTTEPLLLMFDDSYTSGTIEKEIKQFSNIVARFTDRQVKYTSLRRSYCLCLPFLKVLTRENKIKFDNGDYIVDDSKLETSKLKEFDVSSLFVNLKHSSKLNTNFLRDLRLYKDKFFRWFVTACTLSHNNIDTLGVIEYKTDIHIEKEMYVLGIIKGIKCLDNFKIYKSKSYGELSTYTNGLQELVLEDNAIESIKDTFVKTSWATPLSFKGESNRENFEKLLEGSFI